MPVYVPQANLPRSVSGLKSLALVVGCDTDGAPKRPTLSGNYEEPGVPFPARMKWLAKVQRLIATCAANKESYPHKLAAVARALAYVGDVCKPSREYIAAQAGCRSVNTVKACIDWLEEHGALTWRHTARRHQSGRRVRSSNLYQFILDFGGFAATVARTMRAIWRERPKTVTVSKGNGCSGEIQTYDTRQQFEAKKRLAEIRQQRTAFFNQRWEARHAT